MSDEFSRSERRIATLLLLVTVTGAAWHTIEELRPPPPPLRITRGSPESDPPASFDLNGPPEGIVYTGEEQGLTGPIDITLADEETLALLPGIGPVLARRIVEWRARRAPPWRVDDLLEVSGIGPAKLELIRPLALIDAAPPDTTSTEVPQRSESGGKWR